MDVVRPEHDVLTGPNGLAKAIHELRKSVNLPQPDRLTIETRCQAGDIQHVVDWIDEARHAALPVKSGTGSSPVAPTIVLPLDQAEELLAPKRQGSGLTDGAQSFLDIVARLLTWHDGATPAVMVLATIRADSYERLQNCQALADVGSVSFNELTPMDPSLFRLVIEGPAARNVEPLVFKKELVAELIRDCPDADALPLLALTLEQLTIRFGTTGTRTPEEYKQLGTVDGIVDKVVDDVVGKEGDPQRDANLAVLRRAFIPAMATINIYDQPQRLLAYWNNLPASSHALLSKLAEKRILTKTEPPDAPPVIEVAIESLLRRWEDLRGWLTEESISLKAAERVKLSASEWDKHQRKGDNLEHKGLRLREAEKLAAEGWYFTDPDAPIAAYIAACRRHRTRVRISKGLGIALAFGMVLMGVAAYTYLRQSNMHVREATAERLTSEAQAMLAGAGPDGDYRAIRQLIAAPLVTSPDKLGLFDRWTTDPMSASPAISGALLDAVNGRSNLRKIVQTSAMITSVAISRDGSTMATGDVGGDIRLWDTTTAASRGGPWRTQHGVVWSVAYAGDTLVTAANDGTVEKWDSAGHAVALPGSQIGKPTRSIAATTDGNVVAGSAPEKDGADGKVRIWDVGHEQLLREFVVPGGTVESVALHDNVIATGSEHGNIQRWNLHDGTPIGNPIKVDDREVWCVAFSPHGDAIAAAGQSPDVRIHNLKTGGYVSLPHQGGVWTVAFDPAGKYIATGGIDDTIKVWDPASHKKIGDQITNDKIGDLVTGDGSDVKAVAFAGDGLVSVGDDKTLRLWSIPSPPPPPPGQLTDRDRVVGLSLEPNQIMSITGSGVVQRWNAAAKSIISTQLPVAPGATAAVDSAGAFVAVMTTPRTSGIWTTVGQATGKTITLPADITAAPPPAVITDVAIAVGGDRIAAISRRPDIVRFWDIHNRREVGRRVDMGDRQLRAIRLSADGRRLATADTTGRIDVWDTDTGNLVSHNPMTADADSDVNAHRVSFAFSDDNRRLVSGAMGDDQVRLWDVDKGTQIGEAMTGHQRDVTTVAFSHDGRFIISGALDGTVRIWDAINQRPAGQPLAIAQPREIRDPDHLPLYPTAVAISLDGTLIVAGLNDGTVRTWPGPQTWAGLLCNKVTEPLTPQQWTNWVGSEVDQFGTCP